MTAGRARQLLGLPPGADLASVSRAFRSAVKQVHPDRPGGDAERLRQVIEAHRLLTSLANVGLDFPPAAAPSPRPQRAQSRPHRIQLSVCEALFGGERRIEIEQSRFFDVRLPAGLRAGETLRLADGDGAGRDVLLLVAQSAEAGLRVRGHDVWLDVPVERGQLTEGSRLEVDTPRGRRAFLSPRSLEGGGLVRLKGEGLPARGPHPAGDLILQLVAGAHDESLAQRLLRRFSARWAA
jgi:curved DNA-binding protein